MGQGGKIGFDISTALSIGFTTAHRRHLDDLIGRLSVRYAAGTIVVNMNPFISADQCRYLANSADTDETAYNEPSHQDLHCLPGNYLFRTQTPIGSNG